MTDTRLGTPTATNCRTCNRSILRVNLIDDKFCSERCKEWHRIDTINKNIRNAEQQSTKKGS